MFAFAENAERVVLVEGGRGLVEAGERHRLEQEAVPGEVFAEDLAHRRGVLAALVLEALHGVAGRDEEHRVHELALEGFGQLGGTEDLAGEGLGGGRDPLLGGPAPHVERRPDIGPEAVRTLTSASLWRKGSARQPPSSTTFSRPRPVRTKAIPRLAFA